MRTIKKVSLANPDTLAGNSVYLHSDKGGFRIHRVFNAGETSNPALDGWGRSVSREEADKQFDAAVDDMKQRGYTEAAA